MDNKTKAKWGLLLITVLWALGPSFIKLSLMELQEFNLIAFRFLGAFIALSLVFHKNVFRANRETFIKSFLLSIVLFLVFITVTFGVRYTTASKAGFLTCLSVIFVPFLTFFLFKRKPEMKIVLGAVITIVGIALLTLRNNLTMNYGDVLCLLCSLFYSLYIIMTESYTFKCDPIALSVMQMGMVGIYAGVLSLIIEKPHFPVGGVTWIAVVGMALLCTAAAFLIQTVSQKYVKSEDAAIINTLEPLFAAFFSYLFLREVLSTKEVIGAVILMLGVVIAQVDFKEAKDKTEAGKHQL